MTIGNIAILMATYNGEKYLAEQIDSLMAQTMQDWHLYIHDDGSVDSTVSMIKEYADKYPDKITQLDYPAQGGACMNFLSMLERVEAPYYMFCDQDDVWMRNKIELEYAEMKRLEVVHSNKPVIINTDLKVVDADLRTVHPSFWQYRGIYPDFVKEFKDFAATNVATGCTMLFNRQAKEAMRKPCKHTVMHDAWVTMSVMVSGGILHNMKTPTVLYRQHGDNTIGAFDAGRLTIGYRLKHLRKFVGIFCRQFRQMNVIAHITLVAFISSKIDYKRYIRSLER